MRQRIKQVYGDQASMLIKAHIRMGVKDTLVRKIHQLDDLSIVEHQQDVILAVYPMVFPFLDTQNQEKRADAVFFRIREQHFSLFDQLGAICGFEFARHLVSDGHRLGNDGSKAIKWVYFIQGDFALRARVRGGEQAYP